MRKIIFVLLLIILNANFAFAEIVSQNTQNGCNFVDASTRLVAVFETNEYTCASGEFLPANTLGCVACPSGYTCDGGTFQFNEYFAQGIVYDHLATSNINYGCSYGVGGKMAAVFEPNSHECSSGYYLPANVDACTICPTNNICSGGTYSFNETTDQGIQSCASGTFAPTGSAVCYPHILHVGDSNVYLKSTKQTTPSLNFRIGNDIFYANMTTTRTRMNKDSTHYFHAQWADNHYYICDDTTCP